MALASSVSAREAIWGHFGVSSQNPGAYTGRESIIEEKERLYANLSPVDGLPLPTVQRASPHVYDLVVRKAQEAFLYWRTLPAPKRGEVIRHFGEKVRQHKEALARLISYEIGKTYQESLGEVQEVIDMCDFAVGLSRQLYGLTMASERPNHRLYEQWHPLGIVGIITAFNFPIAVWAWNATIAAVCGDTTIWKPSEKAPLSAIAIFSLLRETIQELDLPEGVFNLVIGDAEIGQQMACDSRLPLISATGSVRMGKSVAQQVAKRLGRTLLELGGNNAVIITPHANMDLALRAVTFAALGTSGQRCTTLRRLILHESIYQSFIERLINVYTQASQKIGNPLDPYTLIGPLVDKHAVQLMQEALKEVQEQGGKVLFGGEVLQGPGYESGCYVKPAIVSAENHWPIVQRETFAPILYVIKYKTLEEAISLQNSVPQGLSSSIFTDSLREAEIFLSASGSDCGIANVNIGPSGAEIGGAFGGEKETGGGREAGSDAWKAYMRRQTVTINYGTDLPLAQGIRFDL
ncbi:MAG: aldehyde dehydrogenase family protein [Bacteroidia bacterium]|nr:aldehyde dehydrogenase family protein [Bacteroidia bacterium]MDW8134757.1 aldehyde dehydrogenase family protein [Bacteroidia bacterium]